MNNNQENLVLKVVLCNLYNTPIALVKVDSNTKEIELAGAIALDMNERPCPVNADMNKVSVSKKNFKLAKEIHTDAYANILKKHVGTDNRIFYTF